MEAVQLKSERLEARLRPEDKALMQRAAELSGRKLSEFVISSAREAAVETLRRHESLVLGDPRDQAAFAAALLQPPAPSRRLKAAARRYRTLTGN
ncbi:DUF1778 domain-containing protein [Thioalkalivibrio sp. XN279]|uniref:type II toxin-antitoxin system TacA family antitoxin n=1 Tax=Thioalkalivibrio sp. XN279 TaxID=2714953 RepID=UPI001408A064|nr:DUF1778 domain-containing protein [Thioalkalivibrio sp. XN279]NHA14105.1 DUF1778 domain-containing protein [Thioalkalivibrio sp. XN279]